MVSAPKVPSNSRCQAVAAAAQRESAGRGPGGDWVVGHRARSPSWSCFRKAVRRAPTRDTVGDVVECRVERVVGVDTGRVGHRPVQPVGRRRVSSCALSQTVTTRSPSCTTSSTRGGGPRQRQAATAVRPPPAWMDPRAAGWVPAEVAGTGLAPPTTRRPAGSAPSWRCTRTPPAAPQTAQPAPDRPRLRGRAADRSVDGRPRSGTARPNRLASNFRWCANRLHGNPQLRRISRRRRVPQHQPLDDRQPRRLTQRRVHPAGPQPRDHSVSIESMITE